MKVVQITLTDTFGKKEVDLINSHSSKEIEISAETIKRYPASGGIGWEGIVLFSAGAVFSGVANALGEELYGSLKKLLYTLKNRMNKKKHRFTINITLDTPGIVFFDLTKLNKEDFDEAFDKIPGSYLGISKLKSKGINANYDLKEKKWIFEKNKTSDI